MLLRAEALVGEARDALCDWKEEDFAAVVVEAELAVNRASCGTAASAESAELIVAIGRTVREASMRWRTGLAGLDIYDGIEAARDGLRLPDLRPDLRELADCLDDEQGGLSGS